MILKVFCFLLLCFGTIACWFYAEAHIWLKFLFQWGLIWIYFSKYQRRRMKEDNSQKGCLIDTQVSQLKGNFLKSKSTVITGSNNNIRLPDYKVWFSGYWKSSSARMGPWSLLHLKCPPLKSFIWVKKIASKTSIKMQMCSLGGETH